MKNRKLLTLPVLLALSLSAQAQVFVADFDPSAGIVPSATNLLFQGSTDGTLNIPISDPTDPSAGPRQALNALDGFSTTQPVSTTFSAPVDPATVIAGVTVRVFEVELANPFLDPTVSAPFSVTGVQRELVANVDYTATVSPLDSTRVLIIPLRPLKAATGHLVTLTDGIRAQDGQTPLPDLPYIFARYARGPLIDADGRSLFRNLSDPQAQALEPLRQVVVSQENAAAEAGLARGSIVFSFSFLTQSIGEVLETRRAATSPRPAALIPTGLDTGDLGLGLPGLADIYVGTLQLPYYLQAPTSDPTTVLSTFWRGVNGSLLTRYNPQPVATQTVTVPVLVTVPNGFSGQTRPADGWPAALFLHGITRDRTDLLALADTLAAAGLVGIAIDIPLHGITDPANPFYNGPAERTFNTDLLNNSSGAPGPDGVIDPSGAHFINFSSLLTNRDNLRQGAADLIELASTAPTLDLDGDGSGDIDGAGLRFIGHSLGGIIGTVFLGVDERVGAATLANPGGVVVQLLDGSPRFGPVIEAGLAAAGLLRGTADYAAFLAAAQTAADAGDPLNYAADAAALHPIHLIEVVGDADSLPDQVIPNRVAGAPLAGTEPLIAALGLTPVDSTVSAPAGLRVVVRFSEGEHGSILSPAAAPAVTVEMQTETVGFMASDGTLLPISNPTVIQPVP